MIRKSRVAFCAAAMMCSVATQANTAERKAAPEADRIIEAFFQLLETGKAGDAVSGVINSSPLWANRTGAKEQMIAQIDAANKIYGATISHECPEVHYLGSWVIRKYCFAQTRDMVLRWQFDIAKTGNGWSVAYFGFNDQANNWPDGD